MSRRSGSARRSWLQGAGAASLVVAIAGLPATAHARNRGIAVDSCSGCHGNPQAAAPELSLRATPADFGPGQPVTFSLEIRWPSIAVGGAFITAGSMASLRAAAGSGLSPQGQGLAHTAPKAAAGGAVRFDFEWQAPSTPGAVQIAVAALAGNGNGASSGDAPAFADFQWVYGCEGVESYVDLDRDGYGSKTLGRRLHCAGEPAPVGFSDRDGDCNENDEKVHPGAAEVCNKKDDDCDDQVDEGAEPVEQWPDRDGDGFYSARDGTARVGCGNVPGYAAAGGDCDDLDPAIHPNAEEVCNSRDDDCDSDVDERVRPQCGVGWCSRYSPSCSALDCQPGEPREETCNAFDDDCDGELDNGVCTSTPPCVGDECTGGGTTAATGGGSGSPPTPVPPSDGGRSGAGGSEKSTAASGCALSRSPSSGAAWLLVAPALATLFCRSRSRSARNRAR